MPGKRAGVDPLQARNFPSPQIIIERFFGAPITRSFTQLFDNETADMRLATFLVGRVRSVISDQRVSHGHDLSTIRWIGQHFLITRHGSVETNLTDTCAGRAE